MVATHVKTMRLLYNVGGKHKQLMYIFEGHYYASKKVIFYTSAMVTTLTYKVNQIYFLKVNLTLELECKYVPMKEIRCTNLCISFPIPEKKDLGFQGFNPLSTAHE